MPEVATKVTEQLVTKGLDNGYGYGIIGVVLILLIVFIGVIYYKLDETNKKNVDIISSKLPDIEKQITAALNSMQKEFSVAINTLRQDATASFTKMGESINGKHQDTKDDIEAALKVALQSLTDAMVALGTAVTNLSASSQLNTNNVSEAKAKIDNLLIAIAKVETLVRTCSRMNQKNIGDD